MPRSHQQALPNGQTSLTLRTGRKMPQGGFGLWKLDGKITPEVIVNAVEAGYRLFDGAADYGNEKEVGDSPPKNQAAAEQDMFAATQTLPRSSTITQVKKSPSAVVPNRISARF